MRTEAPILFAISALLLGCPEQPNENNVDNPAADAGSDLDSVPDAGGEDTASGDVDSSALSTDPTVEFVGVEWGLFPQSQQLPSTGDVLGTDTDRWFGEVEIPAGVVGIRLTLDSEVVLDTSTMQVDQANVLDDIEFGPAFNPAPGTFSIEVVPSEDSYDVTLARVDDPTWASDSPDVPTSLGPWWDEGASAFDGAEDPGAVTFTLMNDLRGHGGPVETPDGVLFLAPAQDGEPAPQIRGSWTNWEADPATELRRIRPGLWARYVDVPAGQQAYRIVYGNGETWVTDYSNPHIEWDGIDTGTVGNFNSVLRPEPDGSRMVWLRAVDSPQLGNQRDVYVQLPAGYDSGTDPFPALYFHDGNESIVRGQFHEVAASTASSNPATATVNVFIALPDQNVRIPEYTMGNADARGDAYVNFVAETLVPMVDDVFRTRTERNARGLAGASLGGLISFWGALQHPDVFGYVAGMSSSFFWEDNFMIQQVADRGCQNVEYYIDSGSPADNYAETLMMRDQLDSLGCRYTYVLEENGQHEWGFWRGRLSGVLEDFAEVHGE